MIQEEKTLVLFRDDLIFDSRHKDIKDINYSDVRNDARFSHGDPNFLNRQGIILFIDKGGETRILKNKYGND